MNAFTSLQERAERAAAWVLARPSRRGMLGLAGGAAFALTGVLQAAAWASGVGVSGAARVVHTAAVLVAGVAAWVLMGARMQRSSAAPGAGAFWRLWVVLLGAAFVAVGVEWAGPDGLTDAAARAYGFTGRDAPASFLTFAAMLALGAGELLTACYVLRRLEAFVLFRRTRASVQVWYGVLALFLIASALTAFTPPRDGLPEWVGIAAAIAATASLLSAFRIQWVVYLPLREKLAVIGLALLTLITSAVLLEADGSVLAGDFGYVLFYDRALRSFAKFAFVFATTYSGVALLFLFFHLPTTQDYQRQTGERRALQSLTDLIGEVFDRPRLADAIAASPVLAGIASRAWIALPDAAGALAIAAAHGLPVADAEAAADLPALLADATRENVTRPGAAPGTHAGLRIDDAASDARVRPGRGVGTLLALPLVARGELLGLLVAVREVARSFEQDDADALRAFAGQAALALDHAALVEERVEKERLRRELDIARAVQQRLLPQRTPRPPGLRVAASSMPALEVGGDYYDFADLGGDRHAFIVADVSGKGTSAAFHMAEMQGIFRALTAAADVSPATFLRGANRAIGPALSGGAFVTALYGVFDGAASTFTFARAGHCPPAVVSADGTASYVRTQGMGLGLDRRGRFEASLHEQALPVAPGDALVLFSDGLVESRSPDGEEYGYDRLLALLAEHGGRDADALHGTILADLERFLAGEPYGDDLTLVVLAWHGLPAGAAPPNADDVRAREPVPAAEPAPAGAAESVPAIPRT